MALKRSQSLFTGSQPNTRIDCLTQHSEHANLSLDFLHMLWEQKIYLHQTISRSG